MAVGEDAVVDTGGDGVGDDLDAGAVEAEAGEAEAGGDVDVFWVFFDGVAGAAFIDDGAFVGLDAEGLGGFGGDEGDAVELGHVGGEDAVDAADGSRGQVDAAVVLAGGDFEPFEEVGVEEAADAHDDDVFSGVEEVVSVLRNGFLGGGFEDSVDVREELLEAVDCFCSGAFFFESVHGSGDFVEEIEGFDAGHRVGGEGDVGADGATSDDSEFHRGKPKP